MRKNIPFKNSLPEEHPASLKEILTTPPMSQETHRAIQLKRAAARRKVEDMLLEREFFARTA